MTVSTNPTGITYSQPDVFFLEAHGVHQLIQIHVIIYQYEKKDSVKIVL